MAELRVGLGVDAHALEEGVPLVLGGMELESSRGLAGHSDGDVIAHALTDAVLGAAGLGDIGSLFPSGDETPEGVDSLELMVEASGLEWTFLRCGGFATNLLSWASQIRAGDVVRGPYSEAATAPISERDIAATAARVLLDDGHAGATYVLTGQESLTQIEQAKLIGKAIGRELRFQEIPPELFRKQAVAYLPAPAVDDLLRRYAQAVGRVATISPDIERILGRPAAFTTAWKLRVTLVPSSGSP